MRSAYSRCLRRLAAAGALAVAACGAAAEWSFVSVDFGVEPAVVAYVDRASIETARPFRATLLYDLATASERDPLSGQPAHAPIRSSRQQAHFDCEGRGLAVASWTHYSDVMGRGKVVANGPKAQEPLRWQVVQPETLAARTLDYLCRHVRAGARPR